MDDILITTSNNKKDLKRSLHDTFKMKDLGPLTYFLELEIYRSSDGYLVHQINIHGSN